MRRQPSEGINILVYGAPGLGKVTEFARFLAEECNLELFEVASSDRDGDPIEGGTRLSGYHAALKLLKPSRSMIMFDEAEDIFGGGQDSIFAPRPSRNSTRRGLTIRWRRTPCRPSGLPMRFPGLIGHSSADSRWSSRCPRPPHGNCAIWSRRLWGAAPSRFPRGSSSRTRPSWLSTWAAIVDGQYDETDINVNALPICHCAQRDVFMNPVFWVGGTNVLILPDIGQILKSLAEYKATMFFAPPTVWIGMLRHPDLATYDLSHLKKCYYGASIMPVEILKEIMEKFPGTGI